MSLIGCSGFSFCVQMSFDHKFDHNYGQKLNANEDEIECCRKSLIASAKTPKNTLPKRRKELIAFL